MGLGLGVLDPIVPRAAGQNVVVVPFINEMAFTFDGVNERFNADNVLPSLAGTTTGS